MEFITIAGQPFDVSFDINDNEQTVVETKAVCPDCHGTAWTYSQLCEAGYPGILMCDDCEKEIRLERK